ncbi:16S rRNA processing protein RimM [Leptospira fletcheri]|uniref:Ribosome maturation factor RimM n=1 Tax=Leptospira fletcheri TaxID=2484981 RepID=A0A4R9GAP5_9LEPT|nr:ribosome maturation factor RimM [Leptospira fletcheri]TGK08701.1 16S rRNA processing protein RimM [Leptospira fletcheri]
MTDDRILVGKLGKPFGLKGLVRLVAQDSSVPSLQLPLSVKLKFRGKPDMDLVLLEAKVHSGKIHLLFQGYSTPEDSAKLTGGDLFVDPSHFPPSKEGEFYLFELKGLKGIRENGEDLGWTLVDLMENPAHPILVFQAQESDQEEILIPFLEIYVGEIRLSEKRIVLRNPEVWNEV